METRISQLHTADAKEREIRRYTKTESQHLRLRRTKIKLSDFRTVKVIGKGAFGEVASFHTLSCFRFLLTLNLGSFGTKGGYWQGIRHEEPAKGRNVEPRSGQVLPAFKILSTHVSSQLAHVRAERDVLAESTSAWVVQLFYSFQDSLYLYLIMEFLPGGDLMTMLMKYDIFSEDVTRFYMAECVLAIEAVHNLGYIHR